MLLFHGGIVFAYTIVSLCKIKYILKDAICIIFIFGIIILLVVVVIMHFTTRENLVCSHKKLFIKEKKEKSSLNEYDITDF